MKSLQQEHSYDGEELDAESGDELDADSSDGLEVANESTEVPSEPVTTQTSSGRLVKPPARYRDFVKT